MTESAAALRLAHVDDHETMRLGFAGMLAGAADLHLVASAATVDEIEPAIADVDLVVLDLRLADGSTPGSNVRRLTSAGARVLCFSAAEDPSAVREAAAAGALGIVRKSEPVASLLAALRATAHGETIATLDWAAALDGDPRLADAGLSPQEQNVLALYAAGETSASVARRTHLSDKTVSEYVRRIRVKYALAGRPAPSRVDLYKRAVEDGLVRPPHDGA